MHETPRWPTVIGTIGIVVGVLLILDNVDDLLLLEWTEADWRRLVGPYIADMVVRAMPSVGWRLATAAVEIGLGTVLVVGSVGVRRREARGVTLCRVWAWLAIVWVLVGAGRGAFWLQRHGADLPAMATSGPVVFALLLSVVLLLAFPVFLLAWFSSATVRHEIETWGATG
ncbi:MAG: hypothetical protein VKI81_10940 [Synechococcaceae cyanobacterium]|nr:hypothetical protein [Synechococcaceae cyanobacterium]